MNKRPNTVPETDNVYEEWEDEARNLIVSAMNERKISYKALALRLERLGIVESADQLNRKINRKRFSAAFMLACLDAMDEEGSA
ncbi:MULTISPECIES: DUF6471 domain-containing protein [Paraburkholderia]|uniref:DUF6471 domain-containing protein n=1 Tax=Paraburkholderia TaxID=1822464 RepID=UPI003218AA47